MALEKFTPVQTESWRFSGFKGFSDAERGTVEKLSAQESETIIPAGQHQTIVEKLRSDSRLAIFEKHLIVQKDAVLDFVLFNDLPADVKNFNFLEIKADENSRVNLTIINIGSAYTRQEITAILKGNGANVKLRSLSIAKEKMEIDQRTLQIHEAPGAKSDLLFKNVLGGSSRTIFGGMIRVAPGAQKTDAYQKNCNLILSNDAQANSLPGLEIEADDVRCSHGATCTRLDAEELFYLKSRGIAEAEAKQMLVHGFCAEILDVLPQAVANEIREKKT